MLFRSSVHAHRNVKAHPKRHAAPESLGDLALFPGFRVQAHDAGVVSNRYKFPFFKPCRTPKRRSVELSCPLGFFYPPELRNPFLERGKVLLCQEGVSPRRPAGEQRRLGLVLRQVVELVLRPVSALESP